jgi:hypothetical protein
MATKWLAVVGAVLLVAGLAVETQMYAVGRLLGSLFGVSTDVGCADGVSPVPFVPGLHQLLHPSDGLSVLSDVGCVAGLSPASMVASQVAFTLVAVGAGLVVAVVMVTLRRRVRS